MIVSITTDMEIMNKIGFSQVNFWYINHIQYLKINNVKGIG